MLLLLLGSALALALPEQEKNAVAVEKDVVYSTANGAELRLDIYRPAAGSGVRPAVVLIHGGGWTGFDKSTMSRMAQFLARSGYVAFSVDYRLLRETENRWPAQLDDVQRAVRWVRANARKYGVDAKEIGAFGHSAGAQLAALLGMEETRDNSDGALARYSSKVQAVVDVSGPSDFTEDRDAEGDAFLAKFFGGDYTQHPEIWRDASPVYHVAAQNAPFLIVHGTREESVPIAQSEKLFAKLRSAGVHVSFVKVDDVHTFVNPESNRRMALETISFFNRYLGGMR